MLIAKWSTGRDPAYTTPTIPAVPSAIAGKAKERSLFATVGLGVLGLTALAVVGVVKAIGVTTDCLVNNIASDDTTSEERGYSERFIESNLH